MDNNIIDDIKDIKRAIEMLIIAHEATSKRLDSLEGSLMSHLLKMGA
jgi:hypothetical protein